MTYIGGGREEESQILFPLASREIRWQERVSSNLSIVNSWSLLAHSRLQEHLELSGPRLPYRLGFFSSAQGLDLLTQFDLDSVPKTSTNSLANSQGP